MSSLLPIDELSRQARAQGQFLVPINEFTALHGALRRLVARKVSKAKFTGKPLTKPTLMAQAALAMHRDRIRSIHWPKEKT